MITLDEYKDFFESISSVRKSDEKEYDKLEISKNFNNNVSFFMKVCKEINYNKNELKIIVENHPKNTKHFWNFLKIFVLDKSVVKNIEIFEGLLLIIEELIDEDNKQHILQVLRIISQKQNIKNLSPENTSIFLKFLIKTLEKLINSEEIYLSNIS